MRSPRGVILLAALVAVGRPVAGPPELSAQVAGEQELSGVEIVQEAGLGKMWTFDRLPLDYLEERYDFRPDPEWFDHVRLASLRTGGCSASFVSPSGLVMTNHHCARGCITAVSADTHDYMVEGYYAGSRGAEAHCPNMYLDQLLEIEDVTERIDAAAPAGISGEEETRLKGEAMDRLEEECSEESGLRCQVVSLYHGGIYSLYKYRRYDDVRLVFAPEGQAAFFGGDPDNFTYPRHDLDVTFLRAYENDEPLRPDHYFTWSEAGAAEGEPVFVTGNPGSTGRLLTVSQLEYLRDASYPLRIQQYHERVAVMGELIDEDPSREPDYRNMIFGLENAIKAVSGYLRGLVDPTLMEEKHEWEATLRAAVREDRRLRERYGGAWQEIARINEKLTRLHEELVYSSFAHFQTLSRARDIVRLASELAKPEGERSMSERTIEAAKRRIASDREIDREYERMLLELRLTAAREALGPDHVLVRAALAGDDPEAAAARIIGDTRVGDPEWRQALLEGGVAAVNATDDPAVVLAGTVDAWVRGLEEKVTELRAEEGANEERVAEATFAVYGTMLPPDATFTLRLSDGLVARYPLNGTFAPYKTTIYGLFDRAESFDHKDPWKVAPKWTAAKDELDMSTPLNFVSTADIIGGNSGSPVINRDAEIVGLVFDGNMEMLPNRFLYRDEVARCVSVHSMAIIEALRTVYGAGALADELQGR
ncbi:MAG: S46 family peptidase [Gemmatimonadetes bacterium]|uniref:Dipeptidyl-peptidase n=1 Tax=Candidatus Kutchimonas denitrificans TaxID=3056748 RepID=A0AAE4Z7B1_9BACT|nr:S46 family peptidase [Gemmatimonadota bacterium]NIR74918.1 S46 family peptidase [Candidatus Kutchimonas denitrificans]NIS00030.1 S46 family peptidase [Gemmatimonadota bacterium]NIT65613.1 S46 family peptidase [Gemmatimonadota bacterium]NIU52583.1 S46 family peptidase [Gemmatimonadota bacterium]